MNPTLRKILVVAVLLILFFTGVGSWVAYKFAVGMDSLFNPEIPEQIKEPRVLIGDGRFKKSVFFSKDADSNGNKTNEDGSGSDSRSWKRSIDSLTAKAIFGFTGLQIVQGKVVAVGKFGAYILNQDGRLERYVTFAPITRKYSIFGFEFESDQSNYDDLRIAPLAPGRVGYWSTGSLSGFRVFDENGEPLWSTGEALVDLGRFSEDKKEREERRERSNYVLAGVVGDLDNDGIAEYIVARENDGLRAYRQNGDEMWFLADEFPFATLFVLDSDSDGKNELLGIGPRTVLRNGDGTIKNEAAKMTNSTIYTLRPDRATGGTALLFCRNHDSSFDCHDLDGREIVKGVVPLNKVPSAQSGYGSTASIAFPKFVCARLEKDKPPFYVAVGAFIGIPRANLYVWDEGGNLVYHELLPEEAETISVLPVEQGLDQVLIGGKDTVWRFGAP